MTLLSVNNLRVSFPTDSGRIIAVKDISFDLDQGEVLALVGESGCGKSVTAMTIPRLHPDRGTQIEGSVTFGGKDILAASESEMERIRGNEISMIFQEPMTSLNPAYTAGYQIAESLRLHEKLSKKAALARSVQLLDMVGIPDPDLRARAFPHQMSGGMRQRVMIALAIACNPRLLIADEPTTALDVTVQAGILDVIRRLREELGMAVLLITHDLGVVAEIADRAAVMYAGRKVEEAPVGELFAHPRHPYTVGLLNALPAMALDEGGARRKLVEIPGLVPLPINDPDECQFRERCVNAQADCALRRPPLEAQRPNHLLACYHPMEGRPVASGVGAESEASAHD